MFAPILTFPCNLDKQPLTRHGFKDARAGCDWNGWLLVGYPTGAANGVDVLDIDPNGRAWFDQHRDTIPLTQTYKTQRGQHLLFKHAPGLRCSTDKIAPGVDVRADGGYAIFWPREGYAMEQGSLTEWPEWLLKLAFLKRDRHSKPSSLHIRVEGVGVLSKLNPCDWRDHDRWLRLMMSCHAAGIEREAFVRWSISDPQYAGDGDVIARRWDSLRAGGGVSAAFLLTAVRRAKAHSTRSTHSREALSVAVPSEEQHSPFPPTRNVLRRLDAIRRSVERTRGSAREPALFYAACSLAEIIAEGKLKPSAASDLLKGYALGCGLWKDLGAEGCRATIANGFRHVEEKLLSVA